MKKTVHIILVMFISVLTYMPVLATAAYDVNKEMEYAANHVNDGVGECAEFVSKCVQAGGLDIPVKTGTKGCWDAVLEASGLSGENLVLNSKGYATKDDNGSILSRGDVVIQWCYTCDLRPHILICGGYDSEEYATFYAHNSALDNKRYKFSSNSQHNSTCNIGDKTIHINDKSIILDVPAQIVNGRTLIPVRAIAEALDCTVNYNFTQHHTCILYELMI